MRLSNPFIEDSALVVLVAESDAGWYLAVLETRLEEARCAGTLPAASPQKEAPMISHMPRGLAALFAALALVVLASLVQS
ncbi:MAG: hypothetical protein JWR10_3224 [Rubritepida sp.]|nr:hypothetical protein [Rubritepida sp.]